MSVCAFEGDNKEEEEEEEEEEEGVNGATRREYQAAFRRHRDPSNNETHTAV